MKEHFRRGLTTVLLGASLYGCQEPVMELPAKVENADFYISNVEENQAYVLAQSEEQGCTLAWMNPSESGEVVIYSGKDCDNISLYAKVFSQSDLEDIVREGKIKGRISLKADLTSYSISDEEAKSVMDRYEKAVRNIKKKHLPN